MKDCIEGMSMLPDHSFDAIICDLPYGSTRNKWDTVIPFDELWKQYTRLVKERGAIILFGQGMFTAQLMTSNPRWWRYNLIWEKTQPTGFLNSHKMPLRAHEDICVFYKSLPEYHPIMTKGVRKVSSAVSKRNSVKSSNYGEHQHTDYDSELRYFGRPIPPLSSLTNDNRVQDIHEAGGCDTGQLHGERHYRHRVHIDREEVRRL